MLTTKADKNILLDSYSVLIVSKYFKGKDDYVNIICVNSKFKETTEKLRFNPIPITTLKLFPKIQTQYLYTKDDEKIVGIDNYEIWYVVDYSEFLKYKSKEIRCHHIQYSVEDNTEYGDTIPSCVTMLGDYCLDFSSLQTIKIHDCITSIGNSCFSSSEDLESVELSNNLTCISDNCFMDCTTLTSINILPSIQSIGIGSFFGCESIEIINIPNSVTSINNSCFSDCTSLSSITLPSSLTILENNTFYCCYSLNSIILPTVLVSIGDECFSDCKILSRIELPPSLETIGKNSFFNCGLQSVIIPNVINSIGINCFNKCSSLTDIRFESNANEFTFKVSYFDSIFMNILGLFVEILF